MLESFATLGVLGCPIIAHLVWKLHSSIEEPLDLGACNHFETDRWNMLGELRHHLACWCIARLSVDENHNTCNIVILCLLCWYYWSWLSGMLYLPIFIRLLYPRPTKLEGGYTGFTLSVCPSVRLSVRPSVCRRHGFRSISQVCFGISISNFICMLMVAIGRSLLIFSDVTFKMVAWRPYWIFWFPDSNFTLALNINFKLQRHNTYVYG